MYVADIMRYVSGLVVSPCWFNLHSKPSIVLTLLFSILKIKSSTLNLDVLRGGNVSYILTGRLAHADTRLKPAQTSPASVAGDWGWAASHATLEGPQGHELHCPFSAVFMSTRGRLWPLSSFGWSPSTLHQLSSTTRTVKSVLKVFKCLESQRQKG